MLRHVVNTRPRCVALLLSINCAASIAGQSTEAARAAPPTAWVQKTITMPSLKRGCHVVTRKVCEAVPEIGEFEVGLANFFSE